MFVGVRRREKVAAEREVFERCYQVAERRLPMPRYLPVSSRELHVMGQLGRVMPLSRKIAAMLKKASC